MDPITPRTVQLEIRRRARAGIPLLELASTYGPRALIDSVGVSPLVDIVSPKSTTNLKEEIYGGALEDRGSHP